MPEGKCSQKDCNCPLDGAHSAVWHVEGKPICQVCAAMFQAVNNSPYHYRLHHEWLRQQAQRRDALGL
jgi:hypothetical protein